MSPEHIARRGERVIPRGRKAQRALDRIYTGVVSELHRGELIRFPVPGFGDQLRREYHDAAGSFDPLTLETYVPRGGSLPESPAVVFIAFQAVPTARVEFGIKRFESGLYTITRRVAEERIIRQFAFTRKRAQWLTNRVETVSQTPKTSPLKSHH